MVSMIATSADPFPAADLDTNRSGRLSDSQRSRLKGLARAGRKDELLLAVVCVGVAAFLFSGFGPTSSGLVRPLVGVGFVGVALLLLRTAVSGDALTKDLRSGRVEKVEGAIGRRTEDHEGEHKRWTDYYLQVAGQSFEVDGTAYRAAPDAGYVSLYVLPRSHVILNLERMPDRPLPAGAIDSPRAAVGAALTSVLSSDPVKAAEARAELSAIGNAMEAERVRAATPPAVDQRDARPLADAILGTWQGGPMAMTFLADGTMVVALPGGRQERGRWSIGPDGRLHANTAGRDSATDAWVAGDVLTISENGQGMAYRRATVA
jgi:hypothetical protein